MSLLVSHKICKFLLIDRAFLLSDATSSLSEKNICTRFKVRYCKVRSIHPIFRLTDPKFTIILWKASYGLLGISLSAFVNTRYPSVYVTKTVDKHYQKHKKTLKHTKLTHSTFISNFGTHI